MPNELTPKTVTSASSDRRERITRGEFFERLLITVGVITATVILFLLLWQSTGIILLIFAGIILGIFLRGIASFVSKHIKLSVNFSLILVLVVLTGAIILFFWLLMPSLQVQFDEISRQLPEEVSQLRERILHFTYGRWILEQIPENFDLTGNQSANILGRITGVFSSFLGIVVNISIVFVTGIYFAFNPTLYYEGIIKLFPANKHKRVREVLDTLDYNLRRWIIGRLSVMSINGALTAIGLLILGVPLAIPLGVLTALLNFIPNIGPILAAVPAILIGFTQSTETAIYITILYLFIQNLEGFVLTPMVQQKAIQIPPVLIISAQILLGILFGFIGVLLAVPVVAVFFILVKMLYVEDVLGNYVEVKGEKQAQENN